MLVQVAPPSVERKILLMSLCGKPPPPFIHAGDVYVSRGRVAGDLDVTDEGGARVRSLGQVAPLSVE